MRKLLFLLSVFAIALSCSSNETSIPEPTDFVTGATAWALPKPLWETCPN